ncbi:hypothetical protein [uncultured Aquimarina sp.]|uniref:hypothetical protein n=1 Tax=uncultured Aquimarina sp. TaxID=575652 RepID=UPI0026110D83|nr:hypothetical protein [uncultured Aquimarina sp.]
MKNEELIEKYLNDRLSSNERNELEKRLQSDKELADELRFFTNVKAATNKLEEDDFEKLLHKIGKKKQYPFNKKWVLIAASITLIIGVSVFVFFQPRNTMPLKKFVVNKNDSIIQKKDQQNRFVHSDDSIKGNSRLGPRSIFVPNLEDNTKNKLFREYFELPEKEIMAFINKEFNEDFDLHVENSANSANSEDILELFKKYGNQYGENSEYQLYYATLLLANNKPNDAIHQLNKRIKLEDNLSEEKEWFLALASLYLNDYEKSSFHLKELIKKPPKFITNSRMEVAKKLLIRINLKFIY